MDIIQSALITHLLSKKGFELQESTPKELRFERSDDKAEIIILGSPPALTTRIKINSKSITKLTTTIDDLEEYLKETIE